MGPRKRKKRWKGENDWLEQQKGDDVGDQLWLIMCRIEWLCLPSLARFDILPAISDRDLTQNGCATPLETYKMLEWKSTISGHKSSRTLVWSAALSTAQSVCTSLQPLALSVIHQLSSVHQVKVLGHSTKDSGKEGLIWARSRGKERCERGSVKWLSEGRPEKDFVVLSFFPSFQVIICDFQSWKWTSVHWCWMRLHDTVRVYVHESTCE